MTTFAKIKVLNGAGCYAGTVGFVSNARKVL